MNTISDVTAVIKTQKAAATADRLSHQRGQRRKPHRAAGGRTL